MLCPRRLLAIWSAICLRWLWVATSVHVQFVWRAKAAEERKFPPAAMFSMRIAFLGGSPSIILAPCAVGISPAPEKLFCNCFFFFFSLYSEWSIISTVIQYFLLVSSLYVRLSWIGEMQSNNLFI